MVLEKILESPLDCKEIQPVHSEGDQPGISLEGMMLKLKLQYFGHLMRRVDSLEKTLMLEGIGRQVSRGSAGEYQADEQAGVARLSWRISGNEQAGVVRLRWGVSGR